MKTLAFGIEIETVRLNREGLARAIQSVVGGSISADGSRAWRVNDSRGRTWSVVPDGSLSSSEFSGEIVSPILGYADIPELQQIVRMVRAAGGRVDESCGLHLHVSTRRFDAKALANLAKIVYRQERHIEAALGTSRRRLERYCRPMDEGFIQRLEQHRPKTMIELNETWYGRLNVNPERYDPTRYRAVNLHSVFFRSTVEFRAFNGTLNAGRIKAYIQFSLALAAKALATKAASAKRREFNPATTKYDFRCFLVNGLGLIGDEFKTARHYLTERLAGSAAWKGERRDRRPATGALQNAAENAAGEDVGAGGGMNAAQVTA